MTDDLWAKEVALSPVLLAERLSAFVLVGDPDNISFNEASAEIKKALVGKVNESGFRLRERFAWIGGNRHHPVAWAHFTPTDKGTRIECHFPGTGTFRAVYLYALAPLLVFFIVMGLLAIRRNEEQGAFMLLATGLLSIMIGLIYWSFRNTIGELKDEIERAIWRSSSGHLARGRRIHVRR